MSQEPRGGTDAGEGTGLGLVPGTVIGLALDDFTVGMGIGIMLGAARSAGLWRRL